MSEHPKLTWTGASYSEWHEARLGCWWMSSWPDSTGAHRWEVCHTAIDGQVDRVVAEGVHQHPVCARAAAEVWLRDHLRESLAALETLDAEEVET